MRQRLVILALMACLLTIGAERNEPHRETIDWNGQGFDVMNATAYYYGETTANGSKVHNGGCACNPHLGDVAIVYTLDGQYLGMYECNDTGSTEGLKNGTVIDIYRSNHTQCQSFMKLTDGKVYVKWIRGKG